MVSVPSPVLPSSPSHPPEGTILPSQGPSIRGATRLCWGDQQGCGGRGGALGAVCNAVIPLRPRQNRRLHESPQHRPACPTHSSKGSLDHTRAAAANEQACSPPGEAGRERAESGQGWGAQGPSCESPGAQQVVAWPRYSVTVPTVLLTKGMGCTFGVQTPGLSPARDVSGERSLSQHPASRQELHGCNHAAVSARSPAASITSAPGATERQGPGRAGPALPRAPEPRRWMAWLHALPGHGSLPVGCMPVPAQGWREAGDGQEPLPTSCLPCLPRAPHTLRVPAL